MKNRLEKVAMTVTGFAKAGALATAKALNAVCLVLTIATAVIAAHLKASIRNAIIQLARFAHRIRNGIAPLIPYIKVLNVSIGSMFLTISLMELVIAHAPDHMAQALYGQPGSIAFAITLVALTVRRFTVNKLCRGVEYEHARKICEYVVTVVQFCFPLFKYGNMVLNICSADSAAIVAAEGAAYAAHAAAKKLIEGGIDIFKAPTSSTSAEN